MDEYWIMLLKRALDSYEDSMHPINCENYSAIEEFNKMRDYIAEKLEIDLS